MSGVGSIVQLCQLADLDRVSAVIYLPTQFQEFVPGVNVRVHVVGSRVFATRIDSEAIDYRYSGAGSAQFIPDQLPTHVEEQCLLVSQQLQLPLCGLDLKRTPAGEWY